jgi:hypothetical protein
MSGPSRTFRHEGTPCESRFGITHGPVFRADETEAPQGSTASTENVGGEDADQTAVCCLEPSQDENADTV